MIPFLFWCVVALVSFPLLGVLARPERIYRYPYFMAAVFAIFIVPQAVSLTRFPGAAPESAVGNVLLVSCLCLGACFAGYRSWFESGAVQNPPITRMLDETRLLQAGLVFAGCGFLFNYLLGHTEVQTTELGGWTGPATIYGFFQQLCYPGFSICLMMLLRRPTAMRLGAALLATLLPVQSILFGRREPAALFALTLGLTLYFQLRIRPARWLVAAAVGAAMFAIPATATYRRLQLDKDWAGVRQIDLVENFRNLVNEESVLELRNAAMLIEGTARSGEYQYGAGYWNHVVFRFVPAQWVGERFKAALMIGGSTEGIERELAGMDYYNPVGTTVTGMGDSFQQFGYGGCLFFAGMAVFFRKLWRAASRPDALLAQLLYIQSCTCAMRAVTHWTLDFLPGLLYNAIFVGLAVGWSQCGYLPRALATMKIRTAPPRPPPSRR
jgi:hypothetical protein